MKAWVDDLINEKVELQIAPLIDCVFLLLIYFMVSSSLKRSEADLGMSLPSDLKPPTEMKMPDEQIIEVLSDGTISLNDSEYRDPTKADLAELEKTLLRYRESSTLAGVTALITVAAEDDARHERVIDVLNACAGAGVTNVTFGSSEY
jgi:biopolymer transport protein ExbD